jgi:hypothetical protein
MKENKGPIFRVRCDYERGHDTQHLSKHLREQLCSQLTSVTCENSARGVQMKRAKNDKSSDLSTTLEMQILEISWAICHVLR